METDFSQRLKELQARIQTACQKSGRSTTSVELILVSKTVSSERLRSALNAGQFCFGENKAQELKQKALELQDIQTCWHFIGHLQSNKISMVLPFISLLHSLDSVSLAEKLQQNLAVQNRQLPVLIQVNTSAENTKAGVEPQDCQNLIEKVMKLPNLHLQGLMTIAENSPDEERVRACFRQLVKLRQVALDSGIPTACLKDLSMGMSQDFEWAIEEGATLIRLGSAFFGERT